MHGENPQSAANATADIRATPSGCGTHRESTDFPMPSVYRQPPEIAQPSPYIVPDPTCVMRGVGSSAGRPTRNWVCSVNSAPTY
jgi:hypothetical protein